MKENRNGVNSCPVSYVGENIMAKITQDETESIYKRYAMTVMNPEPIGWLVRNNEIPDAIRYAYERGLVHTVEQISRLRHFQLNIADFNEPYDVGFINAIEFILYITTGIDPVFIEKPVTEPAIKLESPVVEPKPPVKMEKKVVEKVKESKKKR